ncbi:MAG: bifunctional adenosylcobinamide kinase/adenosylcobinamide-phosphate guanylyltransferase [Thiohalomonadaceae bacterium]
MLELILGGARSGKSVLAEQRAIESALEVCYLATAEALDGEMQTRIAHHRERRPAHWRTIEEPIALAATLQREARAGQLILVDCLTLWLSNLLLSAESDKALFMAQRSALLEVLPDLPGHTILVSNEVGMGIVPMGELSRRFVDEAGWLNQAVAERCQRVSFVAAGLPLILKD